MLCVYRLGWESGSTAVSACLWKLLVVVVLQVARTEPAAEGLCSISIEVGADLTKGYTTPGQYVQVRAAALSAPRCPWDARLSGGGEEVDGVDPASQHLRPIVFGTTNRHNQGSPTSHW